MQTGPVAFCMWFLVKRLAIPAALCHCQDRLGIRKGNKAFAVEHLQRQSAALWVRVSSHNSLALLDLFHSFCFHVAQPCSWLPTAPPVLLEKWSCLFPALSLLIDLLSPATTSSPRDAHNWDLAGTPKCFSTGSYRISQKQSESWVPCLLLLQIIFFHPRMFTLFQQVTRNLQSDRYEWALLVSIPTGTTAAMFHEGHQSVLGGELVGCCREHTHLRN